ncbi:hypothetical protein AB0F11_05410 [Streptomyces sp. NPDC032472]|uniref:hypothetical protein n=1 Tax=Streptomyces sp. NPDC032472 TaxID=3155018 RepID=UPI0033D6F0F2
MSTESDHPRHGLRVVGDTLSAQVGSGWAGVDADQAYVWIRLGSGREAQALMRDVRRLAE